MRYEVTKVFNRFENITEPEACMSVLLSMMAEMRDKLDLEHRNADTGDIKWIMTKDTFAWIVHVCDYKCGFTWSVEYCFDNINIYSIMDVKIEFVEDGVYTKNNIVKLTYTDPDWVTVDKALGHITFKDWLAEVKEDKLMKSFYVGCGKKVTIENVIFNNPATIVFWSDGTKTVVKKQKGDKKFDPEKGLAMAICKKIMGNKGNFNDIFKEWIEED